MVKHKTWEEFRDSGLLWFVNTILHMFGWAVVIDMQDGKAIDAYPARVKYRGFDNECNSDGYKRVTKFFMDNAEELYQETLE